MKQMDEIAESFVEKLDEVLSTVGGWFCTLGMILWNYFTGYKITFVMVFVMVLFDAVFGIWASIRKKEYARSDLLRNSISKIAAYGCALVAFVFIEKLGSFDTPWLVSIIAGLIIMAEFISVAGNALIVNPRLFIFKVLQPALVSEIARKLGVSQERVKEAFENKEDLINIKDTQDESNNIQGDSI